MLIGFSGSQESCDWETFLLQLNKRLSMSDEVWRQV